MFTSRDFDIELWLRNQNNATRAQVKEDLWNYA